MLVKKCENCGLEFSMTWGSPSRFNKRKYCSHKCKPAYNKGGLFTPNGEHKKNWLVANKKRFANETPEQKEKRIKKLVETRRSNGVWKHSGGKKGSENVTWKGEDAKYSAKHKWVQATFTKTGWCEVCGLEAKPKRVTRLKFITHWHNLSGKYIRDRDDWKEVCASCHNKIHRELITI